MPTFQYQAVRADGESINGFVFGTSLDTAMGDLMKRGLSVQSIGVASTANDPLTGLAPPPQQAAAQIDTPQPAPIDYASDYIVDGRGLKIENSVSAANSVGAGVESYAGHSGFVGGPSTEQRSYVSTSVVGPLVGKVSLPTLAFFYNQLGTMLRAGVPMVQCLDTLSRQTNDPRFQHVVREMKGHVENGRPMTAGMQRYPEVFTPVMLSIIRTGEEGGFLDESLFTVAKYTEDEIELRNLYRRVTLYPKLLIGASMLIITGANLIISLVAPGGKGLTSPLTNISTWFILGPILIGMFLFFRVGLANFGIKYNWDMFITKIPYIGNTVKQTSMAKFGRAFGALYRAGVPLTKIIKLSADACGNEYMRAKLYPAVKVLESGAGITETLKSTGALSPIVIDMLATGEQTGNLDQMLNKMSDYYQDEAKTRSIQLGTLMGVLAFCIVAIYIGYIIIMFYMNMGQNTSGLLKDNGSWIIPF
ncbi:MAG: type II secretion system F family protein [Armatimonadota bacterium]